MPEDDAEQKKNESLLFKPGFGTGISERIACRLEWGRQF
jgi:hypothetical protein